MDEIVAEFLVETNESMVEMDNLLVQLEQNPNNLEIIRTIFRVLHTIKGTCGFLGLARLERVAHKSEDLLGLFRDEVLVANSESVSAIFRAMDCIKSIIASLEATGSEPAGDDSELISLLESLAQGKSSLSDGYVLEEAQIHCKEDVTANFDSETHPVAKSSKHPVEAIVPVEEGAGASQSLRVGVDVLENLMTMVSELVLTRNQLLQISRQNKDGAFAGPLQRLNLVVSDLQEGVMKTRMQPVGNAWAKLPRIVRDVCFELGKKIDLEMYGQDTELDRQVLEMIKDPLTHMIRNSADHGIETPEDRKLVGKAETGKIILRSYHQGGHIMIELSDDGRGLPIEKIKKKILNNNLLTHEELDLLSIQQIQQYIFHAGFSTAEKVTSVSGRGVGMDVVRSNIEKIGGSIEMRSTEGVGTHFSIKIPLTLAIVSALIIGIQEERFAIPQLSVSELVLISKESSHHIEYVNNSKVLRLRGNLLPLIDLEELMGLSSENKGDCARFVVVTKVAQFMFGIIVDKVYDLEEIVVKPVTRILKDVPLFSGNTILGDGKVIMILDPTGILKVSSIVDMLDSMRVQDIEDDKEPQGEELPLLLFKGGDESLKAAPLQAVSRLEKIDLKDLEISDGHYVIQYQQALMPVVPLSYVPPEGVYPLIIVRDKDRLAGLLVNDIIDIKKYYGDVRPALSQNLIGSVILDGQATDIINPAWYMGHGLIQSLQVWGKEAAE